MKTMDRQESFWSGSFGDEYTNRNQGEAQVLAKHVLFSRALKGAEGNLNSILELGANRGLNLQALRKLLPNVSLTGVELNETAFQELRSIPGVHAIQGSLYDVDSSQKHDLVFTCGVLIHLNPERLSEAYDKLFELSNRYVLVSEYYNPAPVEVTYRGEAGVLYKRDFAGEILARFHELTLVDYGFCYHGDPQCPVDDLTWFLLEKSRS